VCGGCAQGAAGGCGGSHHHAPRRWAQGGVLGVWWVCQDAAGGCLGGQHKAGHELEEDQKRTLGFSSHSSTLGSSTLGFNSYSSTNMQGSLVTSSRAHSMKTTIMIDE